MSRNLAVIFVVLAACNPAAALAQPRAPQTPPDWQALLESPELRPLLARFPHYPDWSGKHLAHAPEGQSDDWQQGEYRRMTPAELATLRGPAPRLRERSPHNITPQMAAERLPVALRATTPTAAPPPAAGDRPRARRGEAIPPAPSAPTGLQMAPTPRPDIQAFGEALHASLAPQVAGYAMQLRQGGKPIYTLQWQWARYPQDGGVGWTTERRMNVASVSKFLSAVALVHALDARGISLDAPIAPWLPQYWARGPRVDQVTFRHLLRHQSGFRTASGAVDLPFMKAEVAKGPAAAPGTGAPSSTYRNLNFGLARVLITTVGGYLDPAEVLPPGDPDALWDILTTLGYLDYLERHVFAPAGIKGASLVKPADAAIAYALPVGNANGWDSGDLTGRAGSGGWHLSVDDLLNLVNTLLRSDKILPSLRVRELIDAGLGLDSQVGGLGGTIGPYAWKSGAWAWTTAAGLERREQSVLVFLPQNMELALLVNSRIGDGSVRPRELVINLFEQTLVMP